MATDKSITLMNEQRINRTLTRMAYQIAELNVSNRPLIFLGIEERGFTIAQSLSGLLTDILKNQVKTFGINLQREAAFSADLVQNVEDVNHPLFIIVDDVIFSGRTMFRALNIASSTFKPAEMKTATLVDRGHKHRKFPITSEFQGLRVATKDYEHVSVVIRDKKIHEVNLIRATK